MGCSSTKLINAVNLSQEFNVRYVAFAKDYIKYLQEHHPKSNMRVIFKLHHLFLFACENGCQYVLNNHTYHIWYNPNMQRYTEVHYVVTASNPLKYHGISPILYCAFANNLEIEHHAKSMYDMPFNTFHLKACFLNVEYYELNRTIKKIANERLNALRQQQESYCEGAITFATNKMQEIQQNAENHKKALETCDRKEAIAIITEYDKLVADNAKYKNIVEESKKPENNAELLAKSIATLENLVNALVIDANDVVEMQPIVQEVQPVVATSMHAVPVVDVGIVERVIKG
jgi:hypothetical protein